MTSKANAAEVNYKAGSQILCQGRKAKVLAVRNKVVGTSNGAQIQVYLHFEGQDPRYDDWRDVTEDIQLASKGHKANKAPSGAVSAEASERTGAKRGKKRPLQSSPFKDGQPSTPLAARRVNLVYFGWHEINCWYDSPYPIQELQALYPDPAAPPGASAASLAFLKNSKKLGSSAKHLSGGSASSSRASTPNSAATGAPSADTQVISKLASANAPQTRSTRSKRQPSPATETVEASQAAGKRRKTQSVQGRPSSVDSAPSTSIQHQSTLRNHTEQIDGTKLYVCDGCMKYMLIESVFTAHRKSCSARHPPGRKVYQRGGHIIWEVDGAEHKLWCQGLALLGKLFIDHKYVIYDVEGFLFYVLTEGLPSKDYIMGFFSKEKRSYDYYNLACIVTLPPFQNRGYARLMIEMSYALSIRSGNPVAGTPERPLSDLGLRTYVAYWVNVIVRYLRQQFHTLQEPTPSPSKSTKKTSKKAASKGETAKTGIELSLDQIADSCGLRVDDVAVALERCGLAQYRFSQMAAATDTIQVLVTPDQLESVAESWKVKPAYLQEEYLLL